MNASSILILPGWNTPAEKYTHLADAFRKLKYRVLVPDFPGFAGTNIPQKPLFLDNYVEYIHTFVRRHSLINLVLIGHSFGGRVGLKYSNKYPKSVRALILSGTPGYSTVPSYKLFLFIFGAKIGKLFFRLPFLSVFQTKIRSIYYFFVGARDFNNVEGVMRQTFKNIIIENLYTYMKNLTVPCLLLWGETDQLVPKHIALRMHATIPHSRLIIMPRTNHAIQNTVHTFVHHAIQFIHLYE